jgi:hypothetical protein
MFNNTEKKERQPKEKRAETAARIQRELMKVVNEGKMPRGFDRAEALKDGDFVRLLTEMPAYAAVRVYAAEQAAGRAEEEALDRLARKRQEQISLPQPARAAGGTAPVIDYMALSSEQFAHLEEKLKAAAAAGKRVPC